MGDIQAVVDAMMAPLLVAGTIALFRLLVQLTKLDTKFDSNIPPIHNDLKELKSHRFHVERRVQSLEEDAAYRRGLEEARDQVRRETALQKKEGAGQNA